MRRWLENLRQTKFSWKVVHGAQAKTFGIASMYCIGDCTFGEEFDGERPYLVMFGLNFGVGSFIVSFYITRPTILKSLRQTHRPETASSPPLSSPPQIGELIVCLIVRSDRQREALGDFEELFNTIWLPKFGPRLAKCVYIAQAARSTVATIGIGTAAAIAGRLWGILGR
jgi:hypothetical protein